MHFLAIYTGKRGHHGLHIVLNGGSIWVGVDFFNISQATDCVALINSILSATIADKMLSGGYYTRFGPKNVPSSGLPCRPCKIAAPKSETRFWSSE